MHKLAFLEKEAFYFEQALINHEKNITFLQLIVITLLLISGCISPEDLNSKIAEKYSSIDSLSYDVQIVRTDEYDKTYTAYIFNPIEADPFVELREKKEISEANFEWNSQVQIQKPNKISITTTGQHSDFVSGGQMINDKWYFTFEPAKTGEKQSYECQESPEYKTKEGEIIPATTNECEKAVQNSVLKVPSQLNDPTKFTVETTMEKLDNKEVIKAIVESADGEQFEIGDIASTSGFKFNKAIFWFTKDDYTLLQFEGTLKKGAEGSENSVGLTTIYKMYFTNMIFNSSTQPTCQESIKRECVIQQGRDAVLITKTLTNCDTEKTGEWCGFGCTNGTCNTGGNNFTLTPSKATCTYGHQCKIPVELILPNYSAGQIKLWLYDLNKNLINQILLTNIKEDKFSTELIIENPDKNYIAQIYDSGKKIHEFPITTLISQESTGTDFFTVILNDGHCRIDECTFLSQNDKTIPFELMDSRFDPNNPPKIILENNNGELIKSETMQVAKEGKFIIDFFVPESNEEQIIKFSKNDNNSIFKLYSASHSGEDQNFNKIKLKPYTINPQEWQIKMIMKSDSAKKIQFIYNSLGSDYPFSQLEHLAIKSSIGSNDINGFLDYVPFNEKIDNFEIIILKGWDSCNLTDPHAVNYCFRLLYYDITKELAKQFDTTGQTTVKRYFGQIGRTERENANFDGGMNLDMYTDEEIDEGIPSKIVTHEMGHVFLLGDEYFEVPDFYEVGTPNIDVEGCPKWCSGELDTTKPEYSNYLWLKNCFAPYIGTNGRFINYEANKTEIEDNCIYVYNDVNGKIDRASRFQNMDLWDFGKNCIPNSGCYFSAHGWLEWRSSEESLMRYYGEFNEVSKRGLRNRLCEIIGDC